MIADEKGCCAPQLIDHWETLFEALLVEDDPANFELRLRQASAAIVDQLNSSHALSERARLLAALRTVTQLEKQRQSPVNAIAEPIASTILDTQAA
jgi:hypothetical protein